MGKENTAVTAPLTEIGLYSPALRALHAAGYQRVGDLAQLTEAQCLALHGMGPRSMPILRRALAEHGLSFAPEND